MNKVDYYVADTNIIIYLLEGRPLVQPFVDSIFSISVISEIELLGWHKINQSQKSIIKEYLEKCYIIDLSDSIKDKAIAIMQDNKIKLADAIIAATTMELNLPLITTDLGFQKIKNLNSLIIPV